MADTILEKARSYALRLIDYRPRSCREIRSRLRQKGYGSHIIEKLVYELKQHGFLDDKEFARLWARSRSQTAGRGIALIRSELLAKSIDTQIVEDTVSALRSEYDEEDTARQIFKRRMRLLKGLDKIKAKARIYGYLRRRGFPDIIIYKLIGEEFKEQD